MKKQKKCIVKDMKFLAKYKDPSRPEITVHLFLGRFSDVMVENVLNNEKTNLRTVEEELLPFHQDIMESMRDEKNNPVSLLSSGAILSGNGVEYRGKDLYADDANCGDGGHSLDMIRRFQASGKIPHQYLPFRFLEGNASKELMNRIITKQQERKAVKIKSRINHAGGFDWIKAKIKGQVSAVKVSYQEGQVKKLFPIDIQNIITLIALVHADSGRNPQTAYLQKKGLMYFYEKNWRVFQKLSPILCDVMEMRDILEDTLIASLGKSITNKEYSVLVEKVKQKGKYKAMFTNSTRTAKVWGGSLMPIFSTVRNFTTINKDGNVAWKKGWNLQSIKEVYKKSMPKLVSIIVEHGKGGPDKIAKDSAIWTLLNNEVKSTAKL